MNANLPPFSRRNSGSGSAAGNARIQRLASRLPWLHSLIWPLLPCVLLSSASAELLFHESFDYPGGQELGETVLTSQRWENDKSQFVVVTGSLDYAGIQPAVGNRLSVVSTSPSLDSVRTAKGVWPAQSSGALYVSFLLKVESPDGIQMSGHGTPVLTVGKTANGSHLFGVNLLNQDGIRLGAIKYSSSAVPASSAFCTNGPGANLPANGTTTCLVVAKYEWVDGPTNDIVTLWVNPEKMGGAEAPGGEVFTQAGTDGADVAGRLTLSRGPHVNLDEIRIGRTWADVTPVGGLRRLANNTQSL